MQKIITTHKLLAYYLILLLVFSSTAVFSEQKLIQGEYQIHYSVFPSNTISPEISAIYGIKRSKNRALLNITPQKILKSTSASEELLTDKSFLAVNAQITGKARNLIGHTKNLQFREISEGKTVYYLAEFSYSNEEHFRFTIDVTPLGQNTQTINLNFDKRFTYR